MGISAAIVKFTALIFAISVALPLSGPALGQNANAASKSDVPKGAIVKIVAFGDSLTAGYGLRARHAFPVKLAKALTARGYNVKITNAGVSGDTTAAGFARLDWAVPNNTQAVILELGANDALRGLDPNAAQRNLDKIVATLTSRNIEVLIAGIPPPSNFGSAYARTFGQMFAKIAKKYGTLYYRNFLKGVILKPHLNQPDGMHPNPKGVSIVVANILPHVEKLIARVKARRSAHSSN